MKSKDASLVKKESSLGLGIFFDDFLRQWPLREFERFGQTDFFPDLDLIEKNKEYLLKLDVPSMDESNLDVDVNARLLCIQGKHEEEVADPEDKNLIRERRMTSFSRSFTIPEDVDTRLISARYTKGVLNIHLPKSKEAQSNQRKIPIK